MKPLLALLSLVIPLTSTAAAYRWVDENSNAHLGSKSRLAIALAPLGEEQPAVRKLPALPSSPAPRAAQKASAPPPAKAVRKTPGKSGKTGKKAPTTEPAPSPAKAGSDETGRNAELCGMFTTYVSDYENKLIGCQGPSCDIFGRALEKYQKKKQSYCR
ncbi:MAG TPA: hypothetical protein ENK51_07750 [Gammaproteobacteria bacterium]|nr:hypothetical protein [Gammaproteobacteria bacterium]